MVGPDVSPVGAVRLRTPEDDAPAPAAGLTTTRPVPTSALMAESRACMPRLTRPSDRSTLAWAAASSVCCR